MLHKLMLSSVFSLMLSSLTLADTSEYGTAEEARALLDRAVVLLQAEGRAAIPQLDSAAFRDRDLYIFCHDASDGVAVVHPSAKGVRVTDYDFGAEMMTATEGEVKEISYTWTRPVRRFPSGNPRTLPGSAI